MTAQHFSLIASDRQEKTSVSQAEDKKNIIALNFSNSGTMCTGVSINGVLGKPISWRKMKCEEEPWCQFPPKRQLHPTALSHSGGWGSISAERCFCEDFTNVSWNWGIRNQIQQTNLLTKSKSYKEKTNHKRKFQVFWHLLEVSIRITSF